MRSRNGFAPDGFRRELGFGLGIKLAAAGAAFLVQWAIAREAGPAGLGLYAVAVTTVLILSECAIFGQDVIVVRNVSANLRQGREERAAAAVRSAAAIGVSGAGLAVAIAMGAAFIMESWLDAPGSALLIIATAPGCIGYMAMRIYGSAIRAAGDPIASQLLQGPTAPAMMLLLIALAALAPVEAPPWIFGASFSLSYCVAGLLSVARYRVRRSAWPTSKTLALRGPLLAGAPIVLVTFTDLLSGWGATLSTGIYHDPAAAGHLRAALQIVTVAGLVNLVGDGAIGHRVAGCYRAGDLSAVKRLYRSATLHTAVIACPILIVTMVAAEPILRLFGPSFTAGATALQILSIAYLASFLIGPTGTLLFMCGGERLSLFGALAGAGVLATLCMVAIPPFGAAGGAAAVGITMIIRRLIGAFFIHHKLKVRILTVGRRGEP